MQFVGGLSIATAPIALLVGRIFVAYLATCGIAACGIIILAVGINNFNE
jgi:hypothetical protein